MIQNLLDHSQNYPIDTPVYCIHVHMYQDSIEIIKPYICLSHILVCHSYERYLLYYMVSCSIQPLLPKIMLKNPKVATSF
jgi:hypothetical protein